MLVSQLINSFIASIGTCWACISPNLKCQKWEKNVWLYQWNISYYQIYSTNGLLNTYLPLLGRGEGFKNLKMSTYEPDDLLYLFVGVSMTKRQWHCTGISVLIHACMCFLERDLFTWNNLNWTNVDRYILPPRWYFLLHMTLKLYFFQLYMCTN